MPRRRKFINVKVSRTGGRTTEVTLDGGRTVADALEAAGLNAKASEDIFINGSEEAELDDELKHDDTVVLVKNIEGGDA